MSSKENPRGETRPHDGRGGGQGVQGGRRAGANTGPCASGGPGKGAGGGRGKGKDTGPAKKP